MFVVSKNKLLFNFPIGPMFKKMLWKPSCFFNRTKNSKLVQHHLMNIPNKIIVVKFTLKSFTEITNLKKIARASSYEHLYKRSFSYQSWKGWMPINQFNPATFLTLS